VCGWKLCARRTKLGQCDLQPLHTERVLATGRRTLAVAQRHRIALHATRTHGRGQQAHHAGGAAGPLFRQDLTDKSFNSSQTLSASDKAWLGLRPNLAQCGFEKLRFLAEERVVGAGVTPLRQPEPPLHRSVPSSVRACTSDTGARAPQRW
jgi:hypothetical protein